MESKEEMWVFVFNRIMFQVKRHFPGGPVVKNLPCNAGDVRSIPGWGTKIPYAIR